MINLENNTDLLEKSTDLKISIALMASFVVLTIQYFVLIYFNLIGTNNGSLIQNISKILVGILFLYALPAVFKRSKLKFFTTYYIAIFVYLINFIFFPQNNQYLIELFFSIFFISLPSFIYAMSIKNFDVMKRTMTVASFVILTFGLILSIMIFTGNASIGIYSMSLSYYILLPSIIYLDRLIDKPSVLIFILFITSFLIILALGSRGPILCIAIFASLKMIMLLKNLSYKNIYYVLGIVVFTLTVLIYRVNILEYLYKSFESIGIQSRSLLLLLRDDVQLSGRDDILSNVINSILENPILGLGIGGDRYILNGTYTHNILFEIVANFGVIVGFFIISLLIFGILKAIIKYSDPNNMIIIWICIGFVHLMVSSSYLVDIKFWIFLGLLLNIIFKLRISKNVKVSN